MRETGSAVRAGNAAAFPRKIFLAKFGQIWAKVIKIWANLIRFGQNRNHASPKTLDLLRLWE